MKRYQYRIYPINIPADLRERIALIHAVAILKAGNKNEPIQCRVGKINKSPSASKELKGQC
jgi:hypothetical protein